MSGTLTVTVGDRGRLVLPADVRARTGITEGTEFIIVEATEGIALLTCDQVKQRVRANLAGESLVEALLAFVQGERGVDMVEAALGEGNAVCGAANWSKVAEQILVPRGHWDLSRALLRSYGLTVEPVTLADAERAADLWEPGVRLIR